MKDLKNLLTDDDAVSPVIGVILMVAITVILAAVIGAFVLGIGGSQETVPQATWNYDVADNDDTTPDEITIRHDGGDQITASNLFVTVTDSDGNNDVDDAAWDSGTVGGSDPVTAGSSATLTLADPDDDVDSATIVWKSPSSDDSNVISEFDA